MLMHRLKWASIWTFGSIAFFLLVYTFVAWSRPPMIGQWDPMARFFLLSVTLLVFFMAFTFPNYRDPSK